MATITAHAGICGFTSRITATSEDGQTVTISTSSECPHVQQAIGTLGRVDAFKEVFGKPHETVTYQTLSEGLPHTACPIYSAVYKAIEVAAGLALPADVSFAIEP